MPAQRMETPISIREAVKAIQNRDYLLPAIQREFVWSAEKIESLFDSLLRGYPVGSFLFWKVEPKSSQRYKFYEFMQNYHELSNKHLAPFEVSEPKSLTVVLDGQQRLTSLAIGLVGFRADKIRHMWSSNPDAYPKRRLYLNLAKPYVSDEEVDREYDFRFLSDEDASIQDDNKHWFPIKDVFGFAAGNDLDISKLMGYGSANKLNPFGSQALGKLCQVIIKDPVIHFFQEDEQDLNRVLNIFVRLNSGGIPLSYSDLLLSIATAQWKTDAREAIYGLVDELNSLGEGFEFNKDFVLKSSLVLTDRSDIRFDVENFDRENMQAIEEAWEVSVRQPLFRATELAASLGYHGKTLTSSNVLIPVAYYLKKIGSPQKFSTHPDFRKDRAQLRTWIIAGLLKGVFSAKTDTLLSAVRAAIQSGIGGSFSIDAIEAALLVHGKSLKFSPEELEILLQSEYGKRGTFSILAAAYPALNTHFKFHLDHMFPKSKLTKRKLKNAGVLEEKIDFYLSTFNSLPNLQLMEGVANNAKLDSPFDEWIRPLREKPAEWDQYCKQHLVPGLPDYSIARNKEFMEGRRQLLLERLRSELPCA